MKYLLVFILITSCGKNFCVISPNATVQAKAEVKPDPKTTDAETESKTVIDQMRDLRDGLRPGAQFRCNF